ncbi:DUF2460 domain-containing protein [Kaistia geumhonensis]|uniref:Uncharacterized protein (TIGR02217 family) n=1 Tax=Kaistia geumhonensis TaxID=410839 RepID=A0ABU0M5V7_9HYPH|nr:DUF2460 domain-containing protein [Kaistia geumhonensis]MCX5478447.1 DUF2460 domain-containing protein [Kaistia geumhonensis]MDQ0516335.1 uncharacterized protein (TIGR02217 family) [Kaistia geumhonensis]
MAFHDVRFPVRIAFGSTGGPERKTEIVTTGSGGEERNAVWANSRRKYNAGYGATSISDIHKIITFFEARGGRLNGFRFKDWLDYKSVSPDAAIAPTDQLIGTGTGALATFQLRKTYTSGAQSWARTIQKPVSGTVRVAVNGVEKTSGTHFNVDHSTGIVTFTGGNIPTAGQDVRAGFEFDVPVRFDVDFLSINLAHFRVGEVPDIPLIEIRP